VVSKAFTVLSDQDKREHYDRYGADPESRASAAAAGGDAGFHNGGAAFNFESEITPEQLFNMFFNGGFNEGKQPLIILYTYIYNILYHIN
jgi:DnaJ family protein B protein 12